MMIFSGTSSRWGAGDSLADFNADAVESIANLLCGAIVVTLAADRDTNDGRIALHASWTVALRAMESHATQGVRTALAAAKDARIQTLSSDTGSVGRTIVIDFALRSEAFKVWITTPSIRTETDGSVLLGTTNGIVAARIPDDARILTDLLFTGLVKWTLGVRSAFDIRFGNLVAVDVGIAGEIFWARTLGLMSSHGTDGVVGTRIGDCTRTDTLTVATALAVWAVVV